MESQANAAGGSKESTTLAVLLVNLDRFQGINDTMGWESGDKVLREAADRLLVIPGVDMLARIGSDEFGMFICNPGTLDQLEAFGATIQEAFLHPFHATDGGHDIRLGCSVGISSAQVGFDVNDPGAVFRRAQVALHQAQKSGGGKVCFFDATMERKARSFMEMERDLRVAVSNGELLVAYQPILELATGKLAGFEALVRWMNPSLGLVAPLNFIPVAEETGIIIPIGEWVLQESCRQVAAWSQRYECVEDTFLAVNLSVRQFRDPNLVQRVRDAVDASGFPFHRLKLEITESCFTDEPATFRKRLEELHALGIQLALDDFGTGYSSLRYLDEFPVNNLKVDKSFVDRLRGDANPAIVRSVVLMAHGLGLDVVAEGIETEQQAVALRGMGCEYGQGYLFSRPLFQRDAEEWLASFTPEVVMD